MVKYIGTHEPQSYLAHHPPESVVEAIESYAKADDLRRPGPRFGPGRAPSHPPVTPAGTSLNHEP